MSSSDTSAIDDKKESNSSPSATNNIWTLLINFLTTIFFFILIIVIYFSLGGLVLYGCKLGQSNILPTNNKCFPYTDSKPEIANIMTNIFTTFSEPQQSMKLNFPYDKDNSKNIILDMFRNYKEEPHSNFLANYFISIIEGLISFNYSSINFILDIMNSLPETLIVLFGPFIVSVFTTCVLLVDHLYVIYLWFANMGWFFKQNVNTDKNSKPIWESVTVLQPIDYWLAICFVFLFCILFWLLMASLPVLPFLTMNWCVLSCLFYTSSLNNKETNGLYIIQQLFKHYKVTIMSIISFFVILSAFSNLGGIPGIFSVITLLLIFFNVIPIGVFKEIAPEGLTPVVSNKQASKICSIKDGNSVKHGLLYNLIFSQKGGASLAKELKSIGKKLTR